DQWRRLVGLGSRPPCPGRRAFNSRALARAFEERWPKPAARESDPAWRPAAAVASGGPHKRSRLSGEALRGGGRRLRAGRGAGQEGEMPGGRPASSKCGAKIGKGTCGVAIL